MKKLGLVGLLLVSNPAYAQQATIYGRTESPSMPKPGSFIPGGTTWECGAVNERHCWDGKVWREIYPGEPHRYAPHPPERVACRAIMNDTHDCWSGSAWYRLPPGQLFGVIAPPLAYDAGMFRTTPLP